MDVPQVLPFIDFIPLSSLGNEVKPDILSITGNYAFSFRKKRKDRD
jgi:hypothetical protein